MTSKETMGQEQGLVTRKDLRKMAVNTGALGMEYSWNYPRQMNVAFCLMIEPILRKIYRNDPDGYAKALTRHMAFFNITPQLAPFVGGVAVSMEEKVAKGEMEGEAIDNVKAALMGPLSGVGDSIFLGCIRVIAVAVGVSLAMNGNILGPILFFIGMSAYALGLSYYVYFMGYNSGKTSITKLLRSGLVKNVSEALGALGMMVLGAMVAANIGVTTPLAFTVGGSEIVLQTILDSILPKMLPLLIFFGTYRLVVKGKKSTYIIAGMFVVGILGSVLHILG